MTVESKHIVQAYDAELRQLTEMIGRMGGLTESQIDTAIRAVVERDEELAREVAGNDTLVDRMEADIDAMVIRLLALRQPMAVDLRYTLAALKIASDLERTADHAENISRRVARLAEAPPAPAIAGIKRMGRMVLELIKDVLDSYTEGDTDKAVAVWLRDQEVDDLYSSLFRELLTYMMEDPRNITPCTHLLFAAKNIERMGDHAKNIAETVYFQVTGRLLVDDLPGENKPAAGTPPGGGAGIRR